MTRQGNCPPRPFQSERYLSPVRALGRSEIAGHNAGSFLLWDIPTYSEIKAVYDLRREDDALLPQEGDGLDQGSVKVYSLIRLQNHSAVRAGAEYSRGVKRNVLWNSTSDFELLYPDVMVDTIGGNLQKEQYSCYGAWSRLIGKAHIGVYGGYRALHEFRQVDPRPRSVTSDLNAALTGGIAAKGYVFDLNAAFRVYKQSQDVSFYDPLGANTSELHFTGLGSHFARFDGAGDFTSSRYNGHGWEVSATVTPGHPDGWTGLLSYNSLGIECLLVANNEVPITDLWIQKVDGLVGYKRLSGSVKWNILAGIGYELRQSTENIIDTGKNKEYALDARVKGGKRAMIMSNEYDRVFPLDIYPEYLLKAIIAFDIDKMENLGIYEVAPEDFALCEFVDTSKIELQKIVRDGLNLLYKEMN